MGLLDDYDEQVCDLQIEVSKLKTRITELEELIDDFDAGSPVLKGTWREMARQAKLGAAIEAMPIKSSLEHWDNNEWIYDYDCPIDQQTSRLKRGFASSPLNAIQRAEWSAWP